jgi:hypothetical protein
MTRSLFPLFAILPLLLTQTASAAAPAPGTYRVSEPVIESAPGSRGAAAVASTGTAAVAVWLDRRGADTMLMLQWIDPHTGEPELAFPEILRHVPSQPGVPHASSGPVHVATDGRQFLVVWRENDGRNLGMMIDEWGGRRLLGQITFGANFSIASNGRNWLLVTQGAQDLSVLLLDDRGSIVHSELIRARVTEPVAASNGDGFLVGGRLSGRGEVMVISSSGRHVTSSSLATPPETSLFSISVIASGAHYLVATQYWNQTATGKRSEVSVQAVDAMAQPISPHHVIPSPYARDVQPRLAFDGSVPVLFFHGSSGDLLSHVMMVPLTLDGQPHGAARPIGSPTPHSGLHVAGAAGRLLLSTAVITSENFGSTGNFEHPARSRAETIVQALAAAGSADGTPHLLSIGVDHQEQLTTAWSDDSLLMAWNQATGGRVARSILVRRLDDPVNRHGVRVSDSPHDQRFPALRRGGDRFGLAWVEVPAGARNNEAIVRFQLIDSAGSPIGGVLTLAEAAWNAPVALTWDGRHFVVVWSNRDSRLVASRVRPDGFLWDPIPIPLMPPGESGAEAQIEWTGDGFVVVWRRPWYFVCMVLCPPHDWTLHVASYSTELMRRSEPRQLADVGSGPPSLAWSGSEAVVAFTDRGRVWLRRVSPGGEPLGTRVAASPRGFGAFPQLRFDGAHLVLLWYGHREGVLLARYDPALALVTAPRLIQTMPGLSSDDGYGIWSSHGGLALAANGGRIAAGYGVSLREEPFLGARRLMFHVAPPPGRSRPAVAATSDSGAGVEPSTSRNDVNRSW